MFCRNFVPALKTVKSVCKDTAAEIQADIEFLQWSALNWDSFKYLYDLIVKKFVDRETEEPLTSLILKFFNYFTSTWVTSGESKWFEGAHPWGIMNNQGIEGKNKDIKASHTFRKRMPMARFLSAMFRCVNFYISII